MNREQKAAAIAEIAGQIEESQAILAVDYRGITVTQIAELRAGLRGAETTFRVVKNSLTERAADQSGAEELKPLLVGPTALAFVRGDVATAAKTLADYGRGIQILPFKGGLMDGATLDGDQLRALSRLPSREVLYGQLVGIVASPVSGLVRSLNALLSGVAIALGQVRDKMQSGEIQAGAPDAAPAPADAGPEPAAEAAQEQQAAEAQAEAEAEPAAEAAEEEQAAEAQEQPEVEVEPAAETPAEPAAVEAEPDAQAQKPGAGESEAPADSEPAPTETAPDAEAASAPAASAETEASQAPDQQDDEAQAPSEAATDAAAEPAKEE
jgi:large subunit ribosomal protein L10